MKPGRIQISLLELLIATIGISLAIAMVFHNKSRSTVYEVSVPYAVDRLPVYYEELGEWEHQVRPETKWRTETRTREVREKGWPLVYNQKTVPESSQSNSIRWANLIIDLAMPLLATSVVIRFIRRRYNETAKERTITNG